MTYAEALLRLANHANLPCGELPAEESFAWTLWNATQKQVPPAIDSLAADVVACLEVVNRELNGPRPSESIGRASEGVIAEVAYSVSGIVSVGLSFMRRWSRESFFGTCERDALFDAVYRIAYARDQLLAGDVDDILEGIERE